jgi:hypothetical protein
MFDGASAVLHPDFSSTPAPSSPIQKKPGLNVSTLDSSGFLFQ